MILFESQNWERDVTRGYRPSDCGDTFESMTARLSLRNRAIILLTLGELAQATHPALAQKLSFAVGPMAGVALGSWRGSDVRGTAGFRTSFVGGGFATLAINKYFALEPQVLYVQKGTELTGPPSVTYTQDYVEIPLLITGTYPLAGSMRFAPTIFAGPAVAFQTSCRFSSSGGTFPGGQYVPVNDARCDSLYAGVGASMRHTDALLVFGGGLNVGPVALFVRYDLGLTKLIVQGTPQDVKTEAWLMSAGFRLPVGKR